MDLLTSAQIRAARGLLRWSAEELASRANIGVSTVRKAELEEGVPPMAWRNNNRVREAFEAAGIEFAEGGWIRLKISDATQPPSG